MSNSNANKLCSNLALTKGFILSPDIQNIERSAKAHAAPPFDKLRSSTRTIMVYTNLSFDIEKLFLALPVERIPVFLTKKKRNIDKKRLKAKYGVIISLQRDNKYRGLNLKKKKKYWCLPTCRKTEWKGEKEYRVNTVIEVPYYVEGSGDVFGIKYYCTECKNYYTMKQLGEIQTFLNQLTIVMSIGDVILNIMMFKNNFKVAGCKDNDDAVKATMILWNHYIKNMRDHKPVIFKVSNGIAEPQFLFKLVMMNLDFKLGFAIDRTQLNKLMNDCTYSDKVHMSEYEPTSHANVNIKMRKKKSDEFYFDCLVIPENTSIQPYFIKCTKNEYKTVKKNSEVKYTTFIVFSSSKIILSGKYVENMKECYEFFVQEANKNKDKIEERIISKGSFREYLLNHHYYVTKVEQVEQEVSS